MTSIESAEAGTASSSSTTDVPATGGPGHSAVLDALGQHIAAAGAARVVLRELRIPPALQDRLASPSALTAEITEAERIRALADVPFWEGLLLACIATGNASADVLVGAGFHQAASSAVDERIADAAELSAQAGAAAAAAGRGNILVVSSLMQRADGAWMHLPMLDFRSHADPHREPVVRAVAAALGGGLLVASGSSYHLYGTNLVDAPALHAFLGHAAQFNPVTDGRWIAHQHREGACALRLSPRGRTAPRVLGEVDALSD